MATATAEPTQTPIPEPIPNRSDATKVIRTWALDRIAHVGIVIDKINRQNRRAERIEKFAATGDVKDLEAPEGEDMGVNIGNEIHYHIQETHPQITAQAPAPPAASTEPYDPIIVKPEIVRPEIVQPVVAPVANGKFGVLPILAAILGTVGIAGIGAGALAIWDRVQHKPVPQVTNIANPLQDWELGVEVTDHP